MSSVSSALTSLASVSTMDFVKHLLPRKDERFLLQFSKSSTIAWSIALIAVAYISRNVEFVLNAAFSLRGLTSGALLGGLTAALLWKRGRAWPVVLAMLASLACLIFIQLAPRLPSTQKLWLKWVGTEIYWPWYTLIGCVLTLSIASLLRRFSPRQAPND
jgi:SSS family solute:Na+ symporter